MAGTQEKSFNLIFLLTTYGLSSLQSTTSLHLLVKTQEIGLTIWGLTDTSERIPALTYLCNSSLAKAELLMQD